MTGPLAAPPLTPISGGSRSIGPFKISALIAEGRRTTAYVGNKDASDGLLVIRELKSELDPEAFEAEARGARVFEGKDSPELVRFPGGVVTRAPAVVGESLATILAHALAVKRPLDLDASLAIAMGIAGKLARSGEKRFHGDLAPHHVLIGYDGTIHLIDAACAAFRERMKAPGRAGYRSPEHVKAESLAPSSDIFVLGVLLFEMTTATRLFGQTTPRDNDAAIAEARLPRPRDLVGDGYPIELQLVLRKLLRPAQAGRFPDGASARDALRLVAGARAELTSPQLGNWLRTTFPDRWAAWRPLMSPSAVLAIEDPSPPVRSPSRAPTRLASATFRISSDRIPPDPTEPYVPALRASDTARTVEADLHHLLGGTAVHSDSGEHTIDDRLQRRPMEEVVALKKRSTSYIGRGPVEDRAAEEAASYATKLALENIESLDDLPPRARLTVASDVTPTPLMEMELIDGQLVGPGGRLQVPIDVVQPMNRLTSRGSATPTPLLDMEPLSVTPPLHIGPDYGAPLDDDPFADFAPVAEQLNQEEPPDWLADGEIELLSGEPDPLDRTPAANPAADLLLSEATPAPVLRHLTNDLNTARSSAPEVVYEDDGNDTIDEGSPIEALPDALVAQVLAEAEVSADGEDDEDREATVTEEKPAPRLTLSESRAEARAESRADTHTSHPPRSDTEPMGEAARARMNALIKSQSTHTLAEERRAKMNIPAGGTSPSAAKPNLVFAKPKLTVEESPPPMLWGAPKQLDGINEAVVPTQVIRERVGPSKKVDKSIQARVPTLVVRERIVPNDPSDDDGPVLPREPHPAPPTPRAPETARVREPIVPQEDTSSTSMVIPIADEELDRDARKKKLTAFATIAFAVFLFVAAGASLLIFLLRSDEIPLSLSPPPAQEEVLEPPLREEHNAQMPAQTAPAMPVLPIETASAARGATTTESERDVAPPPEVVPDEQLREPSRVFVRVRPRTAKIFADGREVQNDSYIEVGTDTVEVLITAPGYEDERASLQPGSTKPLEKLLRKKKLR
jgi:hypothetical protein